ncbi:SusC/RagA family TonB-linked outer membrane protein [Niabella aurantiaca]|uniref:SusC/RagA family TonB-linked outer membrane protein n=1 Tax=Niabella aurantiaca TaxID=379900 RepID=UPI0012F708EC|nr:TonB-dependent receptor [Niabella aurantiaca]
MREFSRLKCILRRSYSNCLLLLLLLCSVSASRAQTTIRGTVKDAAGKPLEGVTVHLKESNVASITSAEGQYSVAVTGSDPVLVFSSAGYTTLEEPVGQRSVVDVILEEQVSKLEEVVVIGYGSQSRQKLTTAVSKLDNKVLQNTTYTNLGSALQGNIPGLQVMSTGGGQPGAAPRIILRGGTSILNPNGAAPLYIVDGVIRPNGLNDVNAFSIESMQVLKDAASTAIYGTRGSNGVVIVTTKSGKPNRTQISYSLNSSVGQPTRLVDYANAHDYIYYNRLGVKAAAEYRPELISRLGTSNASGTGNDLSNNTAYTVMYLTPENEHKLQEGWKSMPDPIDPTKTLIYAETDYQDLIYRNAYTFDHYLDASGGNDKASFYAGLGYTKSQGTATITDYNRLSLNLNASYKILDNLQILGGLQYTNRNTRTVSSLANLFYRSASLPGTAKYKFEDGTIAPGQNQSIGNPDYYFKGPYAPQGNTEFETSTYSLRAKWDISKKLVFEPLLSLNRDLVPTYSFQPASMLNGIGPVVTRRSTSASSTRNTQYQADAVLTYTNLFAGKHSLEAKGGFSHYSRRNTTLSANGQNAATDLIPTLNSAATPTGVSSTISDLAIQSLFSRINYDYEGKYLLSINARYDGSSNLGENNKFGFFPGVSAGWNVDREKFFQSIADVLQLKLRASYGVNGNISGLTDFQPDGSYITTGGLYGGQSIIRADVLPNQDLRWERSKTIDIGADIGFFNGRASIIFDVYNRTTDDLLTTVSLPASSGFSSVFTNLGSLQNKGFEIELNGHIFPAASAFKWNVSLNAAYTKHKILKLPDNGIPKNRIGGIYVWDPAIGDYAYMGGLQEGGRIGDMFAYKQIGIYATDEEAANALPDKVPSATQKFKRGGDVIWADLDGNGYIDDRDRTYMGNPYPDWTGGFNNYFTYKGFSLTIRTDFTMGNTIYNYPAALANAQAQGDALPFQSYIDKMWKQQGDITNTPRYTWQDQPLNIFRGNNNYYEKGDFFAIRQVAISYVFPDYIRRIYLKNLRVFLSGNNLHHFTKYTGINPEDGGQDNGHYPLTRTFTLGISATF